WFCCCPIISATWTLFLKRSKKPVVRLWRKPDVYTLRRPAWAGRPFLNRISRTSPNMPPLNETHDPTLKSWVESADQVDNGFPIQNLPFGVFRAKGSAEPFRVGVAIGDKVLDLSALGGLQPWSGLAAEALEACRADKLNGLMALGAAHWSALRLELSRALRAGSALQTQLEPLLTDRTQIEHDVPAHIGDY